MNFTGGVIIIGSLLWDNSDIRQKWRAVCLKDISTKKTVKVKIRYGRKSQKRRDTYTMIFSNHPTTESGQGIILEFAETIKSFRVLKKQAFALASAEGLWSKDGPSLNKSWGTVGLLINPNIDNKNKLNGDLIRKRWAEIYQNYKETFEPKKYCIGNENSVINKDGFLLLEWTEEMNPFDFLIATPVVPNVPYPLTAKEIANRMLEKEYTEYFTKNLENDIKTFQDDEIKSYL